MQLLDACLAFVLTLAALATVVTTIMEAGFRFARMRKKNLISVMELLNKEIGKGALKMSPEERWEFFSRVVKNPAQTKKTNGNKESKSEPNWKNDKNDEAHDIAILDNLIKSFDDRGNRKEVFAKVTLEYVLRCLCETECVKQKARGAGHLLKMELNRIARKYEEFGSAVSANFKQYAQFWSIVIGILLAVFANVDGVRIFEAYRTNPKLAATVIEQQEEFIEKNDKLQTEKQELEALLQKEKEKKNEIETAQNTHKSPEELARLEKELDLLKDEINKKTELTEILKTIEEAKNHFSNLSSLGVPIGWDYYPQNIRSAVKQDPAGVAIWLLKVIITGFLIGLGAPFWFDVAKRLSLIRRGLKNPNSSSEDRLAARDANGDAEERKKIVEDVVADAVRETMISRSEIPD